MKSLHCVNRFIAGIVLIAFSGTQIGSAYAQTPKSLLSPSASSLALQIPEDAGTIEESYQAIGCESLAPCSHKTVFYIQDAHDSLEAQEHIAKIITHLVQHDGVKAVLEEGYEGSVPTDSFFGFIKNVKLREKVSYFFMDKLRLGAAEYAHINRTLDFKLLGADDLALHRENIKAYCQTTKHQKQILHQLDVIHSEIMSLANQSFPKELTAWIKLKEHLDAQELPLLDYLNRTFSLTQSREIKSKISSVYPLIQLLLVAQSSHDNALLEKATALEPKALFLEINSLEDSLARSLLKQNRDYKIFQYYKSISLFRRLAEIKLMPEEFEALRPIFKETHTQEIADFIARESKKSIALSKAWETEIQNAVKFYQIAHRRDAAIEKSLRSFFQNSHEQNAVLVFGGFHKTSVTAMLRKNQISYFVITPKITAPDETHQIYYKQLMSAGHYAFETPFLVAKADRPPSILMETYAYSEIHRLYQIVLKNPDIALPLLDRELVNPIRSEARVSSQEKETVEIAELVKSLNEAGVGMQVNGKDLASFSDSPEQLYQYLRDYSVLKNPSDIKQLLKQRLTLTRTPRSHKSDDREQMLNIFNALYDQKTFLKSAKEPVNVVIFRGGRGASQFTETIKQLPNVRVQIILGAVDDGRAWYIPARLFGATGVPDAGKSLLDLAKNKAVKEFLKERLAGANLDLLAQDFDNLLENLKGGRKPFRYSQTKKAASAGMKIPEKQRTALLLYLEKFQSVLRTDYPHSEFTFNHIPLRSLLLLGAAWTFRDAGEKNYWQKAVDTTGDLLGIAPGSRVIFPTIARKHLLAITGDGTLYFGETGVNEFVEKTHPFLGMWLLDRPADIQNFERQIRKKGIEIRALADDVSAAASSIDKEVSETTRRVPEKDAYEVARLIPRILSSQLNTESITTAASDALAQAGVIVYGNTTLESNIGSSLITPGMGAAIKKNSRAVKIHFANPTNEADPYGTTALSLVNRIYRYATGKFTSITASQDMPGIENWIGYTLGSPALYQKLDLKKRYIPFDISEINHVLKGRVNPIGLDLEKKQAVKKLGNDYQEIHSEWGFYSPKILKEAVIALLGIHAEGFRIAYDERLQPRSEIRSEARENESFKARHQNRLENALAFDRAIQEPLGGYRDRGLTVYEQRYFGKSFARDREKLRSRFNQKNNAGIVILDIGASFGKPLRDFVDELTGQGIPREKIKGFGINLSPFPKDLFSDSTQQLIANIWQGFPLADDSVDFAMSAEGPLPADSGQLSFLLNELDRILAPEGIAYYQIDADIYRSLQKNPSQTRPFKSRLDFKLLKHNNHFILRLHKKPARPEVRRLEPARQIWYADDREDLRMNAKTGFAADFSALKEKGFVTPEAEFRVFSTMSDLLTAWSQAGDKKPDFVLLDVDMKKTGEKPIEGLLAAIKIRHLSETVPILLSTAEAADPAKFLFPYFYQLKDSGVIQGFTQIKPEQGAFEELFQLAGFLPRAEMRNIEEGLEKSSQEAATVFIPYADLSGGSRSEFRKAIFAMAFEVASHKNTSIVLYGANILDESLRPFREAGIRVIAEDLKTAWHRYGQKENVKRNVHVSIQAEILKRNLGEPMLAFLSQKPEDIYAALLLARSEARIPGIKNKSGIYLADAIFEAATLKHLNDLAIAMAA